MFDDWIQVVAEDRQTGFPSVIISAGDGGGREEYIRQGRVLCICAFVTAEMDS